MKHRKQKDAPPAASHETVTPFFARYLEGQEPEPDAEASVGARAGRAEFTYDGARKATKKSSKKSSSKKSSSKKSGGAKASAKSAKASAKQTLKYPSDGDEVVLYPYKVEAIELTQGARATKKYPSDLDEVDAVTLKYPSDNDEVGYYPTYTSRADVPKGAAAKPREGRIQLSRKRPK